MLKTIKGSFLAAALAVALSVIIGIGSVSVNAAPLAQAATPAPASYTLGMLLQIKTGLPFAWLRSLPASNAAIIDTAGSSEFVIIASPAPQFDGTQWWWAVRRGSGNVTGWVEQNSLQIAVAGPSPTAAPGSSPVPTSGPASNSWVVGTGLTIAGNVPFAWLRATASPAGLIRATVYHGAFLTVRNATPVWDGAQYWWLVNFPSLNVFGYIEQQSLTPTAVAPTPMATAMPPTAIATTPLPPAPTATAAPSGQSSNWGIPSVVRIKAGVPFAWIRTTASSNAPVAGTVFSGGLLLVNGAAQFDGVQYWWPVQVSLNLSGWVEQNSLELVASFGAPAAASGASSSNNSANSAQMTATPTASS